MSRIRSITAFAAVALLVACADTSAGDPASEDAASLASPDRVLDWTPEEIYAVGGFDAPDWATFGSVESVGFDGEGNLYILDGQTSRVTVVSPDGQFQRTLARQGDGPGEIGTGMGMTVTPAGRVVVSDMGKRALVVYDSGGEWVGNVVLDLGREGLPVRALRSFPDGRVVSPNALRMQMTQVEGETEARTVRPDTRPVWIYPSVPGDSVTLAFEAWSPPPPPAGGEATLEGGSEGSAVQIQMARTQAFEPSLHIAPLPDGRLAVVDSVAWRIEIVEPGAGVSEILERPVQPTRVTPEVEEMERQRRLDEIVDRGAQVRALGGPGVFAISPDAMRRMMEDQVANMAFFPEIPVVEALAADPMGRLWVQRSSGRPGEGGPTDLVTTDGRYLGTLPADGLRIPDAFGPGGLAAVVERDEYDVATVRVVRLPTVR